MVMLLGRLVREVVVVEVGWRDVLLLYWKT
jgi:hypothetical protein